MTHFSLCEAFIYGCEYVHTWLGKQPALKEESVTDWLLFQVSELSPRAKYIAFSRHEEARETGADWEWWLIFPHGAWRLRVQAKKLFSGRDNYAHIARTNRYGLQIEKLIGDAVSVNALPIYAFYSVEGPTVGTTPSGVYFALAHAVETLFVAKRQRVHPADVLRIAPPLPVMVCKGAAGIEGFVRMSDFVRPENADLPLGFHHELPPEISGLLFAHQNEGHWLAGGDDYFEGVNSVLITDFREQG